MSGALDGFRILDLTWGIAGPLATMLMADNGAEVVRVSAPGGDQFAEHPGYRVWNRGKKSLVLDLNQAIGLEVFHRLLPQTDALIESFQPGVADRLGIGYETLIQRYPRLVYTSVSGYGQEGSDRDRPGYDGLVQARMGIQEQQPGYREGPIYLGFAMPSYSAAFLTLIGTLTAVLVREQTGRGQHVDTSLRDGALAMMTMSWAQAEKGQELFGRPVWVKRLLVEMFQCSAGDWLHLHTGAQGAFERLMQGVRLDEYVDTPMTEESWPVMFEKTQAWFRAHTREEGLAMLKKQDVPSLPVLAAGGALRDDQSIAMKFVETVHDPELGDLDQIGLGLGFEKTPGAIQGPAPRAGQHTDELLAAAGYSSAQIGDLRAASVVA
ncbi:MAG: CoA transferase [Chloroflexi bacterium]|nr:CoA transferase [Chloroflexota bacterium]